MFYAAFPPEFNSGRMYSGPGAESLVTAATAWENLAAELQSAATAYSSVVSNLTSGAWVGPSSLAMAAAAAPYVAWMQQTAAQAAKTAAQLTEAAGAYETAFAAHVPPPLITANRELLTQLMATNLFGQNTGAIATTEAQYAEMWAQDGEAMDTYFASSATASELTPFTEAPQTTNPAGTEMQAAAAPAAAAAAPAAAAASATAGGPLQFLSQLATEYTNFINGLFNSALGPNGSAWVNAVYTGLKGPLSFTTGFNDIGLLINFPVSQWLKFAPPVAYGALPKDALGAGLGALGFTRGTLFGAISPTAGFARGTLVGSLTVPPSWASSTPAIRTVAAALTAAGPEAIPAAALSEGSLFSSLGMAGMLGSAMGAGGPTVVNASVRNRMKPLKDLKDKNSPDHLKRLVAQISEKPETVQHHNVDEKGLDALLEQLAKKPGIHAVHLKKGKSKVIPSEDAQLG
ncbi:PPE family protein [Mycobacterium lentiflavum]|uniref:PPE family protein n=2 Tax=Mycobacterium simiae complex TaxID=2249310 RepID=A0A0E4H6A3_MYCLN|nr:MULTISPECIES: PPE family protein [Mycobacterium simiae complex]ORJ54383.1 PPE family protein [Mycobacterium simiae]ULP45481.1 PPE family protein [Mycobacterium lentiflavum]CQD24863.1 PPE family protein [Mycobacterium lentiflavum]